jgi:hypothetical protein
MTVTLVTVIGNIAFNESHPGTHRCCLYKNIFAGLLQEIYPLYNYGKPPFHWFVNLMISASIFYSVNIRPLSNPLQSGNP